jgi:hypothetical protein
MKPLHFTARPTFTVVGLLYRGDNKNNEIPQFRDAFYPARAAEITSKVDPQTAYGKRASSAVWLPASAATSIVAANQQATQEWCETRRPKFGLFISSMIVATSRRSCALPRN